MDVKEIIKNLIAPELRISYGSSFVKKDNEKKVYIGWTLDENYDGLGNLEKRKYKIKLKSISKTMTAISTKMGFKTERYIINEPFAKVDFIVNDTLSDLGQ